MLLSKKIKAKLLRFLTKNNEKNYDLKDVKKIIFFRYDRIGDMILTTPVFRELKTFSPEIKITVLASKSNKAVLKNNPYVDEIFINNKNNFFGDFQTLLRLRKKNFDACVEFDHSVVPHAILRLKIINPKIIISVAKEGRYGVEGSELLLYNYFTEKKRNFHFRDIWLETLKPFGVKPKSSHYDLFCTDAQKKEAHHFISKFRNKFLIGINLEGAVKGKKIEFNALKEICQGLYKVNKNIQVFILTAPNNHRRIVKMIGKMKLEYVQSSFKTNTIMDVAALINQMDLIITPDTSIAHIASAYNKPVVTIHENNQDSYQLFAPTSELNRTIFSRSQKGISDFSVLLLLRYCDELIKNIIKKNNKKIS